MSFDVSVIRNVWHIMLCALEVFDCCWIMILDANCVSLAYTFFLKYHLPEFWNIFGNVKALWKYKFWLQWFVVLTTIHISSPTFGPYPVHTRSRLVCIRLNIRSIVGPHVGTWFRMNIGPWTTRLRGPGLWKLEIDNLKTLRFRRGDALTGLGVYIMWLYNL